jgi:hypothetical protein
MSKRALLLAVLLFLLLSTSAWSQFTPSPACDPKFNGKLICVLPQTYGPTGLTLANPNHFAHFVSSFQQNFAPLTLAVGTQLVSLPLASPASGVLFTYDPSLGIVSRSTESYGPIFAERAETIGRHKLYVAGYYQFFGFGSLDGISLKHIPATFSHAEFPIGGTIPPFEKDFITTDNRIDLKVHQVTLYGTFGLTNRIDVSVAVPILDVRMGVSSAAHIVRIAPQPVPPTDPNFGSSVNGFFHYFVPGQPANSLDANFHNASSAAGIGDVIFRVKGTVLKQERTRVAVGLDVRAPTGDELNFLGSGATGVRPFIAASYRARVSPHANLGFEWNGDSVLAGNVGTGTTAKLPNIFSYTVGIDAGITKRLTGVLDLLGQRLSNTVIVQATTFVDPFGTSYPNVPTTTLTRGSVTINDLSVGVKYSPVGNLLLTGDVLIKMDHGGLRAKVVPLVGVSYTF